MIEIMKLIGIDRVVMLHTDNKTEALERMVDVISTSPAVTDKAALHKAIFQREEILSTGIGLGVAIPHAKIDSVTEFVVAVGLADKPIEFTALDGKPVRLLIMIAGPHHQQKRYLQILARLVIYLKNQRLRERLLGCKCPEDVVKEFASFLEQGA